MHPSSRHNLQSGSSSDRSNSIRLDSLPARSSSLGKASKSRTCRSTWERGKTSFGRELSMRQAGRPQEGDELGPRAVFVPATHVPRQRHSVFPRKPLAGVFPDVRHPRPTKNQAGQRQCTQPPEYRSARTSNGGQKLSTQHQSISRLRASKSDGLEPRHGTSRPSAVQGTSPSADSKVQCTPLYITWSPYPGPPERALDLPKPLNVRKSAEMGEALQLEHSRVKTHAVTKPEPSPSPEPTAIPPSHHGSLARALDEAIDSYASLNDAGNLKDSPGRTPADDVSSSPEPFARREPRRPTARTLLPARPSESSRAYGANSRPQWKNAHRNYFPRWAYGRPQDEVVRMVQARQRLGSPPAASNSVRELGQPTE